MFSSTQTQTQILEAELVALNLRATLLTDKRAACAASLGDTKAAGQRHLLSGDVDDEMTGTALQDRASTAQRALTGIDAALAALAVLITEVEQAIAAEISKVKCERDAAALAAIIASLESRFGPWLEATRAIAAGLEEVNGFRYQAAPLAAFYRHIAGEGEIALRVVLDDLSGAIGEVARGERVITIGKPESMPAPTPAPARKDIFNYAEPPRGPGYRVPGASAFSKEN